MSNKLFSQLRPFEWRSFSGVPPVQFPITQMSVRFEHSLASHGTWGQDGARQESTGREPLIIEASIPFINGIAPGKNERWGDKSPSDQPQNRLYPEIYRAFLRATASRATGTLIHPELGEILCKVQSVNSDWTADRRGGCDVKVTWKETLPDDAAQTQVDDSSPIEKAMLAGKQIDLEIERYRNFKKTGLNNPDFFSIINQASAAFDQVGLLSYRVAGKLNAVLYRVGKLEESILGVVPRTIASANSVQRNVKAVIDPIPTEPKALKWAAIKEIKKLENILPDIREKMLQSQRSIAFFQTRKPSTLASLTVTTGAKIKDLVELNPGLVNRPLVPANTVVRYYA